MNKEILKTASIIVREVKLHSLYSQTASFAIAATVVFVAILAESTANACCYPACVGG